MIVRAASLPWPRNLGTLCFPLNALDDEPGELEQALSSVVRDDGEIDNVAPLPEQHPDRPGRALVHVSCALRADPGHAHEPVRRAAAEHHLLQRPPAPRRA